MASAHIKIGVGTDHAAQLRRFVDRLRDVQQEADRLKDIFDQAALGSDWTSLGALLDITAEDAETVYNILGSVVTELDGTFINQILGRLG